MQSTRLLQLSKVLQASRARAAGLLRLTPSLRRLSSTAVRPMARVRSSWDDNNRIQLIEDNALLPSPSRPLERQLLDRIPPEASVVMIGEASHGTEDFYAMRAEITKLLIQERGFAGGEWGCQGYSNVVVEADFPDAFRANLYVRGLEDKDRSAREALGDFHRFPTWMWRNVTVASFLEWLRDHNKGLPHEQACGFYGMDMYALHASAAKVIEFLDGVDPDAAKKARGRYACFDRFGADSMAYAYAVGIGGRPSCADAALSVARELSRRAAAYSQKCDGAKGRELAFAAQCNSKVVQGAERYYRNVFGSDETTWNIRDSHFLETVQAVRQHLGRYRPHDQEPRLVLWAHNSHLGDARATEMGWRRGELNIGQLCRETFGLRQTYSIGFTTHTGSVTAANNWDTPGKRFKVRRSMPGSIEYLMHKTGMPLFALDLRRGSQDLRDALEGPLLMRHIGVVYRPQTERQSHYIQGRVPSQFDAIIHIDETLALEPLDKEGAWEVEHDEAPDTYPFGE